MKVRRIAKKVQEGRMKLMTWLMMSIRWGRDVSYTIGLCTRQCLIKAISYVLHWGEKYFVSLVLYTNYGWICLYKSFINWMSHIIMLLDACTTCLHTAVHVGVMKRLVSSSNALVLSAVTIVMRDSVLELFDTGWNYCIHFDGSWDCIICSHSNLDQFSDLVS